MKTLFLALFALVSTSLFAQEKTDEGFKFNKEVFDFGQIKQGVPAKATFVVTNNSDKPLIIEQAIPSCGCTVGDFTKEPIEPGKTGTVTAVFNAAALGPISKTISVKFANVDEVKFLKLSGKVINAEDFDKAQAKVKTAPRKG